MSKMREPKTVNEIFAENLANSGYAEANKLNTILNKLTEDDVLALSYACYRAHEKVGDEAFEAQYIAGEDAPYENIVKKDKRRWMADKLQDNLMTN